MRSLCAYSFCMSRKRRPLREGFEDRNIIIRRGKDSDFAFLYFAVIFGTAVYLIATAVCKGIFTVTTDVLSYIL